MKTREKNIVLEKCIDFSLNIIKYSEELDIQKKFVISKQLLRSGTSIGANVYEAQDAESKADFIHKLKIAIKEVNETQYWLTLCEKAESYPSCDSLNPELTVIAKLLNKIISTSINNLK